jgi:ATP-grasp domain, R2K clade family 3
MIRDGPRFGGSASPIGVASRPTVELFYDDRDDAVHEARGSKILYWLDDLGAKPLREAKPADQGFLFAGARPLDDYRRLVAQLPLLRDRPEERAPLLRLDAVLDSLTAARVEVPMPKTWQLSLDCPVPEDLTYPLFVRAAHSSLKLGGRISRVRNPSELETEAAELRRALGWDALILARRWHDLAEAGQGVYGPIPQEIRVWIVDGQPLAWSFHYLNVLAAPKGFPPAAADLRTLAAIAGRVATAFRSRCVAADFARETRGGWLFIEAGPGSCAGTAHEAVFTAVAARLRGEVFQVQSDAIGGIFEACDAGAYPGT